MMVGDLVYSDDFDCNFNYAIYDCTEEGRHHGAGAELLFSTARDGFRKPLSKILDMEIKCVTISNGVLVVEATN